jgi:tRNA U34 2-thiouridine synthase MnmA/TrmU
MGVHVKNWDKLDENGTCSADNELIDAQIVCEKVGIDLIQTECIKEYWNDVFQPFLNSRENGVGFNIDQAEIVTFCKILTCFAHSL